MRLRTTDYTDATISVLLGSHSWRCAGGGAPTQTNIYFSLTILCTIILEMSRRTFYLHKLKQLHYNYNNYLICSSIPQSVRILISTFLQLVFVCNCIEPLETRKDWEISRIHHLPDWSQGRTFTRDWWLSECRNNNSSRQHKQQYYYLQGTSTSKYCFIFKPHSPGMITSSIIKASSILPSVEQVPKTNIIQRIIYWVHILNRYKRS